MSSYKSLSFFRVTDTVCHAVCGVQDGLCPVWLTVLVMLQVVFKMVCVLSGSHFL